MLVQVKNTHIFFPPFSTAAASLNEEVTKGLRVQAQRCSDREREARGSWGGGDGDGGGGWGGAEQENVEHIASGSHEHRFSQESPQLRAEKLFYFRGQFLCFLVSTLTSQSPGTRMQTCQERLPHCILQLLLYRNLFN